MRPTYANVAATVALIIALAAGGPALAETAAEGLASAANGVKKVLRIAKKADRRSRQAIVVARRRAQRGAPGERGPKGDPGTATGPAGGALSGTYPNPRLAPGSVGAEQLLDGSVTGAKIAPQAVRGEHVAADALTGEQIDESSLVGFDVSGPVFGEVTPLGQSDALPAGNGVSITLHCAGAAGSVGVEVTVENDAPLPRSLHATALSDGESPRLRRLSLPALTEKGLIEIPPAATADRVHAISVLIPAPQYETLTLWTLTRPGGQDACDTAGFRTRRSG